MQREKQTPDVSKSKLLQVLLFEILDNSTRAKERAREREKEGEKREREEGIRFAIVNCVCEWKKKINAAAKLDLLILMHREKVQYITKHERKSTGTKHNKGKDIFVRVEEE